MQETRVKLQNFSFQILRAKLLFEASIALILLGAKGSSAVEASVPPKRYSHAPTTHIQLQHNMFQVSSS